MFPEKAMESLERERRHMSTLMIKSDKEIQKDVMKELDWDPLVDAIEVGVQVEEGLVTLTGNVANYAKKLAAKRAAHRVAGVLDVVNNLTVELPLPHQRTDQELAKAVRNALEWDVLVPDSKIHSTVSKGWVTLEGEVESWADKTAAESAIRYLAGMRGMDNRIEIKPKRRIDSGTIRHSIENALARQAHREAERISLSVNDGIVTLTGTVRSWSEKEAIRKVASYAPGVLGVEDLLTIDSYS
jgi:osmotically-inducible protein OsmY